MRTVICHYHIYKNSGTSFDALLTENYGDKHICFDGPFPFFSIDQEEFTKIIQRKNDKVAFSSHQVKLPVPVSLDFHVLPVVFVRHPLLRVLSIYNFKAQTYDGTTISKAAREMSFDEWITYCFGNSQELTQISNSQTRIVGSAYRQKPLMRRMPMGMEYDIHQAIRNIDCVKLLARTEHFNEDVKRFPKILCEYDIKFEFKDLAPKNVTSKSFDQSIEERIDGVKQLLSEVNYQKLLDANMQDKRLLEHVSDLLEN